MDSNSSSPWATRERPSLEVPGGESSAGSGCVGQPQSAVLKQLKAQMDAMLTQMSQMCETICDLAREKRGTGSFSDCEAIGECQDWSQMSGHASLDCWKPVREAYGELELLEEQILGADELGLLEQEFEHLATDEDRDCGEADWHWGQEDVPQVANEVTTEDRIPEAARNEVLWPTGDDRDVSNSEKEVVQPPQQRGGAEGNYCGDLTPGVVWKGSTTDGISGGDSIVEWCRRRVSESGRAPKSDALEEENDVRLWPRVGIGVGETAEDVWAPGEQWVCRQQLRLGSGENEFRALLIGKGDWEDLRQRGVWIILVNSVN